MTVLRTFTFFAPPDLHGTMRYGDDSYNGHWESPRMSLDFDLSDWANSLDLADEPYLSDQHRRRMTKIGGVEAKLVSARTQERLRGGRARVRYVSGVYFPRVPPRMPELTMDTKLNLIAWCDESAACQDAETVFRTIEFY